MDEPVAVVGQLPALSPSSATASTRVPSAVASQPSGVRARSRPPTAFSSAASRRETVEWLIPSASPAAEYRPRRTTASSVMSESS